MAATAREARRLRIPTPELNALLTKALRDHVPPLVRNKRFKLFYATEASIDPPTFVLFVNDPHSSTLAIGVTSNAASGRPTTTKAPR